jgi:hypothetical protein
MDRLFVAQIVIAIEQQWLDTKTCVVNRAERKYNTVVHLFAAEDEEDAYKIVSGWINGESFSDANHDGTGDVTKIFALGIHDLTEIESLSQLQAKTHDIYGVDLPGFYLGDLDKKGIPLIKQKEELEVFRLYSLIHD